MSEQKSDLINLCGLWQKTNRSGDTYFSGRLGYANVVVYPNKWKKTDKHPDYLMKLGASQRPQEAAQGRQAPQQGQDPRPAPPMPTEPQFTEDDIPF